MMDLVGRVKKSLCNSDVVSSGATLIVGVSGGPDSVALLHILARLRYELGVHLHAAHFNHNLRKSARLDQRFVERLAERLNVPCTSGVWRNPPRRPKMSLEELARLKRFDFFQRLAKDLKASAVILGHTRDDLAETVLMRILRGTGLSGMRAILPQRQMEGVCFIRPLLETQKAEIVRYLKNQRISYRLDPTNRQTKFFRNKIRLRLLPLLEKEYSQNIREVLCHLAETAAADYAYMEDQAGRLFKQAAQYCAKDRRVQLSIKVLRRQPQAIRRMLIRLALQYLQESTNRLTLSHIKVALCHVREVEDLLCNRPPGALVHLPGGICVGKREDSLFFTKKHLN
ncbi:MAG: tRNA lysidine(34) synthetase TilS [Omnitrophica WOR_2 bacterium RIFCSPLOWO2_12_FULL_50_9]|nr:MAG: tRNA lysidine(34) synthetase TilS [Omnitrophica WOR_2 bacterium RIFCSPHIGHO2_02_FULL_50_17]OGX40511.1 MAG: tRNA lysidine(34) synthetase TilS [Omnitrophica WOR_2 bacterium RIFCSPLOWO2_12_FULL_50_9]